MIYDEVLKVVNERMAQIDKLILYNANSTLELIDMQIEHLNDVEERTEDKQLVRQTDEQIQQLKSNRMMMVLLHKYVVSNELNVQEKRILTKLIKRI